MLHYNFPPFSVGEVGRTGSPGRREIGHGKLAWRAINPLLPSTEEFPYTLRVVSTLLSQMDLHLWCHSLWYLLVINGCRCSIKKASSWNCYGFN